jgi:hypothetical protein
MSSQRNRKLRTTRIWGAGPLRPLGYRSETNGLVGVFSQRLRIFTQKSGTETPTFLGKLLTFDSACWLLLHADGKSYSGAIGAAAGCTDPELRRNGGR